MNKYEITNETMVYNGVVLHKIRALRDFLYIQKGCLGGWIEKVENLSQKDDCFIYNDAKIFGDAYVSESAILVGNSMVSGNAQIFGNAKISHDVKISEDVKVFGNAEISGNTEISGNASIFDDVKLFGDLIVYDCVKIFGNTQISGNAKISKQSDYMVFKNWWSSGRYFTWTRSNNMWTVGCFYGTGKELIEKAYSDNELFGQEYERIVKYVEDCIKNHNL